MLRFVTLCLALWLTVIAWADGYQIDRYEVEMDLAKSGQMKVVEKIQVTFTEPRRGIFRLIPQQYEDGRGSARAVYLTGISVGDERGTPLTTAISSEGIFRKIRIGDADITLPAGTQKTYVIGYTVRGMMNWFDQNSDWEPSAQLYWNAIGDQWDTQIGSVGVRVRFPSVEGGRVRAKIFAGPYGSRENIILNRPGSTTDANLGLEALLNPSTLEVQRTTPLRAYEALSIVVDMPASTIDRPTQAQIVTDMVQNNLGFGIPIVSILGTLLIWLKVGRDPKGGPMMVMYDAPDELGGAEVGTLLDERVDQRDIAAGIIALAVKGYLTIEPQEEGWIFKRKTATMRLTNGAGQPLTSFESVLLGHLRKCGNEITESELRTHVAPHLSELQGELYEEMVTKGYYRRNPQTVRVMAIIFGILGLVGLAILATILHPFNSPVPGIAGSLISLPMVIYLAYHMPKRTPHGARVRQQVVGFEDFMRRVEKDQIEWMEQKHPDALLFEKYLPHAVALGLSAEWARRFVGIVQENPSWYLGSNRMFSPYLFSNDLGAISNSMGAAAATPPRSSGASGGSSGFGGGGFSGGGFGGGGGGSW